MTPTATTALRSAVRAQSFHSRAPRTCVSLLHSPLATPCARRVPPPAPTATMALVDATLSIMDGASIKVLLLPVGKITRQKFEEFKGYIVANRDVSLMDITRQSTIPSTSGENHCAAANH